MTHRRGDGGPWSRAAMWLAVASLFSNPPCKTMGGRNTITITVSAPASGRMTFLPLSPCPIALLCVYVHALLSSPPARLLLSEAPLAAGPRARMRMAALPADPNHGRRFAHET